MEYRKQANQKIQANQKPKRHQAPLNQNQGSQNKNQAEAEARQPISANEFLKKEIAYKLATDIKKLLEEQKYKPALELLEKILRIAPHDEGALLAKAQILMLSRKLRDADKTIDFVLELHPKNHYAYLSKAMITVLYTSKISEAIKYLDKGLELHPDCFELIIAKGQMIYWLGDKRYNLWIARASIINSEQAQKFLKKYWVESLPAPASYPAFRLYGLISQFLFAISQQKYT